MLLSSLARKVGLVLRGQTLYAASSAPRRLGRHFPVAHFASSPPPGKPRTMDEVQALFAESLLLLADAEESRETTYFEDDFVDAKQGVNEALTAYSELLDTLPEETRRSTREANDPKFNQLREQFSVLEESLIHDD